MFYIGQHKTDLIPEGKHTNGFIVNCSVDRFSKQMDISLPTPEPNVEPYTSPEREPYADPNVEPYTDTNTEPYVDPNVEPYTDTNTEPYADPNAEPYTNPN